MDSISVGTLNLLEAVAFLAQEFGSTMQAQANASAIPQMEPLRNKHHFVRAVPMLSLRQPHIGRLSTIAMPTACLLPMASCSIMNPRSGRSALSRKKSFAPPAALKRAVNTPLSLAILRSNGIGDGRRNTSRQCGAFCNSRKRMTS
jgi:hypothetical protein